MSERGSAAGGGRRMPRVVPEVVAGTTAPDLLAGLEGAVMAWRQVAARVAAPAAAAGGAAAALEIVRLTARIEGSGDRLREPEDGADRR